MRRPRPTFVWLATLALMAAGCGGAALGSADPATSVTAATTAPSTVPRATAPAFTLTLFDGGTFDLAEHLATDGRPVFLNFWASWCPPCREEMPEFDAAARAHPDVLFVGVAVDDDPVAARDFAMDELGISYPIGADQDGSIAGAYDYLGLPTSWLIDGDGTILFTYAGRVSADLLDHILGAS